MIQREVDNRGILIFIIHCFSISVASDLLKISISVVQQGVKYCTWLSSIWLFNVLLSRISFSFKLKSSVIEYCKTDKFNGETGYF